MKNLDWYIPHAASSIRADQYPFLIFTFQEMRKEKAKRFNLNKSRISGRRVAITLGANTVAKIKGENYGGMWGW